jgi:mono/diheme cytochrome c family protein
VRAFVVGLVVAAAVFAAVALATAGDDEQQPRTVAAARSTGATVFARMGCASCHTLAAAGATGEIGPSLDERLPDHTADSLRAVIVSPPAGSMMPDNFGSRMSDAELDQLVSFLLSASRR